MPILDYHQLKLKEKDKKKMNNLFFLLYKPVSERKRPGNVVDRVPIGFIRDIFSRH